MQFVTNLTLKVFFRIKQKTTTTKKKTLRKRKTSLAHARSYGEGGGDLH